MAVTKYPKFKKPIHISQGHLINHLYLIAVPVVRQEDAIVSIKSNYGNQKINNQSLYQEIKEIS